MIIVEGPDGSGKSELIRLLDRSRVTFKSLTGGIGGTSRGGWSTGKPPLAEFVSKVIEGLDHEAAQPGRRVAFDRFHLSERVYGPILRQKQVLDDPELQMLSGFLRDKRVPVILCLPAFEVTLANVEREGRERPSYQTREFLREAYEAFQLLAPWATTVYDYTRNDLPNV